MPLEGASADVSKEDKVSMEADLLHLLHAEVAQLKRRHVPVGNCRHCVLCALSSVNRPSQYSAHLGRHCDNENEKPSMKQLTMIKSIYDADTRARDHDPMVMVDGNDLDETVSFASGVETHED